jgi:glycosyltransferase involved in cell wall biosynthesis
MGPDPQVRVDGRPQLVLIANARLPSERAQSLQVVQVASAFARAVSTALVHPRRVPTPALPAGQDLFDFYAVRPGPRARVETLECADWIDRGPRRAQVLTARLQEWSFARAAARWVARAAPDAVVLSRELECARWLALRQGPGRGFRGRIYLELHRVPGGRLRRRWLGECAPRLAGIVAISGGVAEGLAPLGLAPGALVVEHDGFEAERFQSLPSRAEARAALGLDPSRPVVVYTGSLLPWKGVDVLLEAARLIPEATFLVAGGPAAPAEDLRARAADLANFRVDGFQPPGRVALYLAAADIGVVPNRSTPAISARYTSPLKIFEAMAAGLPLVASDLFSMRDILTDGVDALLVAPDDPGALAGGLRRLLEDPALRAGLAARLAERAPAYGWDARAGRLLRWMGLGSEVGEA